MFRTGTTTPSSNRIASNVTVAACDPGSARASRLPRGITGPLSTLGHPPLEGEEAARTALNEQDDEDEDEDLADDCSGKRLEELGGDAEAQRSSERSPERSNTAEHHHHEAIHDVDLAKIWADIANLRKRHT